MNIARSSLSISCTSDNKNLWIINDKTHIKEAKKAEQWGKLQLCNIQQF